MGDQVVRIDASDSVVTEQPSIRRVEAFCTKIAVPSSGTGPLIPSNIDDPAPGALLVIRFDGVAGSPKTPIRMNEEALGTVGFRGLQWAILDSNQRPLPCDGSALAS